MLLSRLPKEICDPEAMFGTNVVRRRLPVHGWLTAVLLLEVAGTAAGTYAIRAGGVASASATTQAWACIAGAVALWLLAANSQRLYNEATILSDRPALPGVVWAAIATFGIVLLAAVGWQNGSAPLSGWQAGCALAATAWMLAVRTIWSACLRAAVREGRHVERALVVADTPFAARSAAAHIERSTAGKLCVAATTAVSLAGARHALGPLQGFCSIDDIEASVRNQDFDRVLIVVAGHGGLSLGEACAALVARLARLAIDVTVIPQAGTLALGPRSATQLGGLAGIDLVSRPFPRGSAALKRTEDILVAGVVLLAASPLILVVAALIKLESSGPAFFCQQRVGLHDRVFRLWKFRTMYVREAHYDNGTSFTETASLQTRRHDSRVTRVGRVLRRTSLDELPQFLNVFLGEMSVVGPRPHAVGMTIAGQEPHNLVDAYNARHRIKPGITGWAQVNSCRGEIDTEAKLFRRLALDCQYISNWSLALDIYVIVRTAAMLAFDRQAY